MFTQEILALMMVPIKELNFFWNTGKASKLYCYNVRGFETKLSDLSTSVEFSDFDIILLVERKLGPDISDSELSLANYTTYCFDMSFDYTCKTRGDGVLIAVKSNIKAVKINFASL